METLSVIKIVITGAVTSFRYPHFTQGFQPTFEMPPPSTIYGHICSAAGDYIDPAGWQFGYHFTHAGKFVDYKEHLHYTDPIQPYPFDRELLFKPKLELYVTRLDLEEVFLNPRYAVTLGRSQDLMRYSKPEKIELFRAERGYFEHTLLPLNMAARLGKASIAVTMPRYIDERRRVQWGNYTMFNDSAIYPPTRESRFDEWDDNSGGFVLEGDEVPLWIDRNSPAHRRDSALRRAVWLHSFVE